MEENRNNSRTDENSNDNDQLRGNTMNEAIREVSGNPETDLSKLGAGNRQESSSRVAADEDLQGSDPTQGMSYNPNDMSAVRSGGTSDMDDQTAGGAGLTGERRGAGSNLTQKNGVTGSDFDGQNATS